MENAAPAPLVVGEEWYQQLLSYGISRAIDSEFLLPYTVNSGKPYVQGERAGSAIPAGGGYLPTATKSVLVSPLMVAGGVLVGAGLLYLLIKS